MNLGNCSFKKEADACSHERETGPPSPITTTPASSYALVEEGKASELTDLLHAAESQEIGAPEHLLEVVYSELRRMASQKLATQSPRETINVTALVDEVWIKVGLDRGAHYANRAHFFAAVGEAMRRILIDRARARRAAKRGGGKVPLDFDALEIPAPEVPTDRLLDLQDALKKLGSLHPHKAELVKLRYFVGMTIEEAAAVLGIAVPTAKKWWAYARAWLRNEMN